MVLFDHLGCLKRYETVQQIMQEFFGLRLKMYEKRKKYMEGTLGADACKLSNQARFILEKCDGSLKVENKKKKMMIDELSRRGYDSDPVKTWKKSQETHPDEEDEEEDENGEPKEVYDGKGPDYDYLLGMPMWNLTQEKKDAICKNRDERNQELKRLKATSIEDMWLKDMDEFLEKLDEVEAKEKRDVADADADLAKMKKGKGKAGKGQVKLETLPSAHAIRVEPVIADDLKLKASKAVAAKERKEKGETRKKKVKEEHDEFDEMAGDKSLNTSLSKKLGKKSPKKGGAKKGEKKKNPWSDSDASGGDMSEDDLSDAVADIEIAPRERAGGKRAAASKAKFKFEDSEDSDEKSGSDDELHDNTGIQEKNTKSAAVFQSESEDEAPHANGNGHAMNGDDSGSDFDDPKPKKPAAKKPAKKLNTSDDLFDNMMGSGAKKPAPKKPAAKKPPAKKPKWDSDGSGSDFDMDDVPVREKTGGRQKKTINYGGGDSSDGSDSDF